MNIKVLRINQNGNTFFVGKMKAADLIRVATTKVRKQKTSSDYENYLSEVDELVRKEINEGDIWYLRGFSDDENIQRSQSLTRLKEIGKYIQGNNTIFPNTIICNIAPINDDDEDYVDIRDDEICFDEKNVEITVIDGQHRLGGFNYTNDKDYYLENYELVVTFLIGLKPSQQAELFSIINGKQKAVNKSVLYDLSSISESEYSEQLMAHLITVWFNTNEKSPLKDKIKMLGIGEGTVSQATVIEAIEALFSSKNVKDTTKFELPIFRNEYLKNDSKRIIQELLDYLTALNRVFKEYWADSVMTKSTGIAGVLKAYPTFYVYLNSEGVSDRNSRYALLKEKLEMAIRNGFEPKSENYPGGGASLQKKFAIDLINASFGSGDDGCGIRSRWENS